MDYYERALYNQVLGSKQDKADAEKPLVTYFIGLTPGHVRDYTPKQGTTCCEGTGMESATKYQDSVYLKAADGSALYVNLCSPSQLTWVQRGMTVTQLRLRVEKAIDDPSLQTLSTVRSISSAATPPRATCSWACTATPACPAICCRPSPP